MIWIFVMIALLVMGWYGYEGRWNRRLFQSRPGQICVNLRPQEAHAFLQDHAGTQVLDVRSDAEFRSGALPGAIHISIGDSAFLEKTGRLDKTKPVLVYCAGGMRSRQAVGLLKPLGFQNIQHLHRGYYSWRAAGWPTSPPRPPD